MPENKTASLLLSGGDERLTLNSNGINKYGCRPTPDDEILNGDVSSEVEI